MHLLANRYERQQPLGQGGMGVVFVGVDRATGRRVAIKQLRAIDLRDPQVVERFHREAITTSQLRHPHIVEFIEFVQGPEPAMVLELLEGESLREWMNRQPGPLPIEAIARVVTQMLSALEAAHRIGVVHRDVKPSNIFILHTPQGPHVKLLDFGVAKLLEASGPALTRASQMIGSATYMPPEQIRGHEVDARTDLYAFGLCLYEMLTGRRPYEASSVQESMMRIMQGAPVPEHAALTPVMLDFLRRASHPDRAQRFADASAMARAFQDALQASSTAARPAWVTAMDPPASQSLGYQPRNAPVSQSFGHQSMQPPVSQSFGHQPMQDAPFSGGAPPFPAQPPMTANQRAKRSRGALYTVLGVLGVLLLAGGAAATMWLRAAEPELSAEAPNPSATPSAAPAPAAAPAKLANANAEPEAAEPSAAAVGGDRRNSNANASKDAGTNTSRDAGTSTDGGANASKDDAKPTPSGKKWCSKDEDCGRDDAYCMQFVNDENNVCRTCSENVNFAYCGTPHFCPNITSNPEHCGGCGKACGPNMVCGQSKCLPKVGIGQPCESQQQCPSSTQCTAGTCGCMRGQEFCSRLGTCISSSQKCPK